MPLEQPIRAKRVAERPDEYLSGVPNRDLTEDEFNALDTDQRDLVRKSGLYDVKTAAEVKPAVERVARAAERATEQQEKAEKQAEAEKGGER